MRFPLALTAKIASHIIKHKLARTPKFALVLQLEPLHTCNLTCTGCGRIREYSTSLKDMMNLEDCLASARECDAPMVSICGGEPLIYPKIKELVAGLLALLLAAPLNVLLRLIGLRALFGLNVGLWVSTLAAIFAIGPTLMKMLIGNQFPDFRLEASRGQGQ